MGTTPCCEVVSDLITEYTDSDTFAREWQGDNEADTRMVWQLLGELKADELLIRLPEWLAEAKVDFVDGATPTMFIGRIDRETDKAIRVVDSAAARPLMKLAHRIHHLEAGIQKVGASDEDRREWLERRLRQTRSEFESRDDVPGLSEAWIPKSQLITAVRRNE